MMNSRKATTLATHLESFFRNRLVLQRRCSPATVSTYRDGLRLLLIFASRQIGKPPSRLAVEDLDRDLILAFLDHLESERKNSIPTRNARLAAIKSFFQHIAYNDPSAMGIVQRVLAIQEKRTIKTAICYLRQEDGQVLLSAPDRNSWQGDVTIRCSCSSGKLEQGSRKRPVSTALICGWTSPIRSCFAGRVPKSELFHLPRRLSLHYGTTVIECASSGNGRSDFHQSARCKTNSLRGGSHH